MRDGVGDVQWINFYLNTFVVLRPGADIKKAEEKFKTVYESSAASQIKEAREKYGIKSTFKYGLQPMTDIHLSKTFKSENGLSDASSPVYTKILGGIALFMLVIATINFVNLSVARSLKRAKEIGVRKVVGGERRQLIAQFLGESYMLSFCSFLLAILLVIAVMPVFNKLSNKALSFSYLLDVKLIAVYVGLFIFTGLLAGFYPALVLSRFNPVQTLYNRLPFSGKNYLAKALVVLQFSLTTILIISTITIYSQFNFLTHFDLGYNDKNLVLVNGDMMKADRANVFKNELLKDPAVLSVGMRQRGQWGTGARVDGKDIGFAIEIADHSYLPTLEVPVISGRNFSPDYPSDSTQSVLVNEAFVKEAGWKDISGKQVDFYYDSIKYNVVGVVKNFHYASLMEEIKPQLFTMNPKYEYGQFMIKIRPGNTSQTLKHIEQIFKSLLPFVPYAYEFKDNMNAEQYAAEKKWKQIIFFAAILTIFISCIGLFGLAALAAEKRTKEIGIRKVLGASVGGITAKLSGSFIKLVMLAAVVAFPVAWWVMHQWLQNYPYRIGMGVWVFAFAAGVVLLIALCTVSFQAIKAAIANPVKSLRTE
jgi:putative ABC transport system permease protein